MEAALEARPQAAVVATPASCHLEAAGELARAGVHLLVEKPIAAGIDGVRELVDLCETRGVTLMTGYNLRFMPSMLRFRELLGTQVVGRVLSVRAEVGQYLPSWRPGGDYRHGVSASFALGGGVLLELSHEIDYLRWLFGEIDWVSAVLCRQSALDIDVEDTAHLQLGFVATGASAPVVASLNMDFVRHDATRVCTVIGEAGSLRWKALEGTVELFEQGASAWQVLYAAKPDPDDSYRGEWRHFLECIAKGAEPLVSGHDGLAVLRVIDAARRSSAARKVMPVDSPRSA